MDNLNISIKTEIKTEENNDCGAADEANDLLKNGILVETSKGLVCMSLNDALSSDLNLSADDLRNVAAQLILQQNVVPNKDRMVPQSTMVCDSDGFSSECSDSTYTVFGHNVQSSFLKFSLTNEVQANNVRPKILAVTIDKSSEESDSTKSEMSNLTGSETSVVPPVAAKKKGRGGWPKGRKRKPELLNLPPKAPATGYNLYLNEQRISFKDSQLPFYEITKIIGNRWSSLTLEQKKPYLEKAEEDKRRYREELKQYRQSDAYRSYLTKKRKKKLQNNVLSESDMDATDDFDEEDNEELYCRTCDQWFHSLHNKKEHLLAKKHLTSMAGDINRELGSDVEAVASTSTISFSTSLDESSLDGMPNLRKNDIQKVVDTPSIYDAMCNLANMVQKRETEIKTLTNRQQEATDQQKALVQQLLQLNERYSKLHKDLTQHREKEKEIENAVFQLWQVPSWFIVTDFNTDTSTDFNDGTS